MNFKTKVFVGLLTSICLFGYSQDQDETQVEILDEVVVTDTRFELKKENSGKTVIQITKEELEKNSGRTLADIINTKSGITINGSQSNAGQNLSTFVRGGQNRQVLVLIDGVAVSDPSQIENNFDLQLIALDQIESVEILKGASSALYGNRASTAVINIITKKTSKNKISANFSSFIGTNNDQNESSIDINDFTNIVGVNGTLNKFNYRVNFSNTYTDGLSAIRSEDENMPNESDAYSKHNTSVVLGYDFNENFQLSVYGGLDKYKTEFDESFGFFDADYLALNEQKRVGLSSKYSYEKGSVQVNAALNEVEREFQSAFPSKFKATSMVIDIFNKYQFSEQLFTIIGFNYINTEMDSYSIPFGGSSFEPNIISDAANDDITDPYASITYLSDFGLNVNAGIRLNNHSEYGSNVVYNINPSYNFYLGQNTLKLVSSYSTAYITPSLFQLFAPGFGNTELDPQEDATLEAGAVFSMGSKFSISVLYFNRDQDNFIDYVVTNPDTFEGEYQNLSDEFKVQGLEVETTAQITDDLRFDANYTFTERKDGDIFRVPKHKANAILGYNFSKNGFVALHYQFNSDRVSPFLTDDFTANRILESYSLFDLDFNHVIITDTLKVFASIENLFNEDYEELYRFSTLGRNYHIGFTLTF